MSESRAASTSPHANNQPSRRAMSKRRYRHVLTAFKVLAWTIMAIVLLVVGTAIATVQILRPERLTPIAETLANKMVNADVSVARIELSLKGHYPFLHLAVDSLAVTSRDIKALPQAQRAMLPQWADTLLAIDRLQGGIHLPQAMIGKIRLSDVIINAPTANIVDADSVTNNYAIVPPDSNADAEPARQAKIPDISISSFAITNPRAIRYANIADSLYAKVDISDASIASLSADTLHMPCYDVSIHINISSSLLKPLQGQSLQLGCN
ncbi:MAG: AsmA family protein, partial [Bacteroides sp.]|nr:AsmA family protein [Bacteroides sp.]